MGGNPLRRLEDCQVLETSPSRRCFFGFGFELERCFDLATAAANCALE